MAHVDANHTYAGCRSDLNLIQSVMEKGAIVLDDFHIDPIRKAAAEFCTSFECELTDHGAKAVIDWHGRSRPLEGFWW